MAGSRDYIIKRLISLPVAVFLTVTVVFFLFNVLPGDAAQIILGRAGAGNPYLLEENRKWLGLDRPVYVRYVEWVSGLLRGDLGVSLISKEPVTHLISRTFPTTMVLTVSAALLALAVGLPTGIIAGLKRGSKYDLLASTIAVLVAATPSFWLGLMLILVFSVWFRILPSGGFTLSILFSNPAEGVARLVLPSITLSSWMMANVSRITRSSILEELNQDYVMTAKSKGLPNRIVVSKHVLRNALIPITTVSALQIVWTVGGSVITESVFRVYGMGNALLNAVYSRDFPVVQGCILVIVITIVIINFVTDLMYRYLDPRIRLQ